MSELLYQWEMTALNQEFELAKSALPIPGPGEVLVKVAGCGVCHTDLSFWHDGVPVRHDLPLTLGHEVSGTVVAGPAEWLGRHVVVPAVLPCGECDFCKTDRSNICRNQKMPGNDFHGGFASHILVPYKFLCPVSEGLLEKFELAELAVVADAISTPYQVVLKSEMKAGDLVIAIGVGGIGLYGVQIAKSRGGLVLALDIDDEKLRLAKEVGADAILNTRGMDIRAIKGAIKELAKELKAPSIGWKILEMSGTKTGQEIGYALITYASTLSIVGFTMDKLDIRLSNLMAFDAKVIGTWGCRAELYPEILDLIEEGKIIIKPFVQTFGMSKINEVFKNTLDHQYKCRSVLIPDFEKTASN